MGVDFLDLTFRLEKSFGIKDLKSHYVEMRQRRHESPVVHGLARLVPDFSRKPQFDLQAGRIHEVICRILTEAGCTVPRSSWHRVQFCIAKTLSVSPKKVKPQSWLIEELGFD